MGARRGQNGARRLWEGVDLAAVVHTRFYPPFLQLLPSPFSPWTCICEITSAGLRGPIAEWEAY